MPSPESDRYRDRQRLAATLERRGRDEWRSLRGELSGWPMLSLRLAALLASAQQAAASGADAYVESVVGETEAAGAVSAAALAGVASDGRPLESLLQQPAIATRVAMAQGATRTEGFAVGEASLRMILRTQVADAGRVADGVAIAARPGVGYVRMLVGKSCSRCAILAGRFYRWNAGFRRHPRCDCIHVPAKGEQAAQSEGLVSDPKEYFESLSKSEQDRIFTKSGAQAIRDGADMNQVVNARRGMSYAGARITAEERRLLVGGDRARLRRTNVLGQDVFTTTEGTTTRGIAGTRLGARETGKKRGGDRYRRAQVPRLMPESIYELASSREDAIRLLKRFGYIV